MPRKYESEDRRDTEKPSGLPWHQTEWFARQMIRGAVFVRSVCSRQLTEVQYEEYQRKIANYRRRAAALPRHLWWARDEIEAAMLGAEAGLLGNEPDAEEQAAAVAANRPQSRLTEAVSRVVKPVSALTDFETNEIAAAERAAKTEGVEA